MLLASGSSDESSLVHLVSSADSHKVLQLDAEPLQVLLVGIILRRLF